jgi:hypothetical protein
MINSNLDVNKNPVVCTKREMSENCPLTTNARIALDNRVSGMFNNNIIEKHV